MSRRLWGGGNTRPLKTTAWEATQTPDGAKIFVETVGGLFILEIPQETVFFVNVLDLRHANDWTRQKAA